MNHGDLVKAKRTLHPNPSIEEYVNAFSFISGGSNNLNRDSNGQALKKAKSASRNATGSSAEGTNLTEKAKRNHNTSLRIILLLIAAAVITGGFFFFRYKDKAEDIVQQLVLSTDKSEEETETAEVPAAAGKTDPPVQNGIDDSDAAPAEIPEMGIAEDSVDAKPLDSENPITEDDNETNEIDELDLDSEGLYELGLSYYQGDGVEQSFKSAALCWQKAADLGSADAYYRLGLLYSTGRGVERSYIKEQECYQSALSLYTQAAEQGDLEACYQLGTFYYNGTIVDPSKEKATEYLQYTVNAYTLAASTGDAEALYRMSRLCSMGVVPDDSGEASLDYLIQAANMGYSQAQNLIGIYYFNGYRIDQSYEKALSFFLQAAEQGNASALYYLGNMYSSGLGVEQSYQKAAEYYQKSSDLFYIDSYEELGYAYENGLGVERSYEKAREYYQLAADSGRFEAQLRIDYLYPAGIGKDMTYEEAVDYYRQKADKGDAEAQFLTGIMYYIGPGGSTLHRSRNITLIEHYLHMAEDKNYAAAQFLLGYLYDRSFDSGSPESITARNYYEKSANNGNKYAQYYLGIMFSEGDDVEQSYEKAVEYLRMAADQGVKDAEYQIERCLFAGNSQDAPSDYTEPVRAIPEEGYEFAFYSNRLRRRLFSYNLPEEYSIEGLEPGDSLGDNYLSLHAGNIGSFSLHLSEYPEGWMSALSKEPDDIIETGYGEARLYSDTVKEGDTSMYVEGAELHDQDGFPVYITMRYYEKRAHSGILKEVLLTMSEPVDNPHKRDLSTYEDRGIAVEPDENVIQIGKRIFGNKTPAYGIHLNNDWEITYPTEAESLYEYLRIQSSSAYINITVGETAFWHYALDDDRYGNSSLGDILSVDDTEIVETKYGPMKVFYLKIDHYGIVMEREAGILVNNGIPVTFEYGGIDENSYDSLNQYDGVYERKLVSILKEFE